MDHETTTTTTTEAAADDAAPEARTLTLDIEQDGRTTSLRTPTLFVGNNRLQLERVGIDEAVASGVGRGSLGAVAVAPTVCWALIGDPSRDPDLVPHEHPELGGDHEHVRSQHASGATSHAYVIDDLHPEWTKPG